MDNDNSLRGEKRITLLKYGSDSFIALTFIVFVLIVFIDVFPDKFDELYVIKKNNTYDKEFPGTFENALNENFPLKKFFVDINGLTKRLFLQREMNGVVLLNNGHEYMIMEDRNNNEIAMNAESLKQLSEYVGRKCINFLYVQVPQKLDADNNELPAGLDDYADRIADEFLKNLAEKEVDFLDIRKCIKDDGINRYSLFLSTEHHWSARGGFYAFKKICEHLNDKIEEEIPDYVVNLENYNVDTYKNASLGYYGQRTGWMFGGFDDFELIYPKWETIQSSWAPHNELLREGTFYDAIFLKDYLNYSWRERGLYGTYIGGDWPLVVHHSETAPIDKTIMILIDSYGTVTESFLTTVFKNVIAIDLRWVLRNNMGKTTVDYIEEYKPEILIVMFNPSQIGFADGEQFQYGIEIEKFDVE